MEDISKQILNGNLSALKLIDSPITGTITAPATPTSASNEIPIPHGLGNDELIPELVATWSGFPGKTVIAPYATGDGRVALDVSWDETYVYITASSSTAGSPQLATTFDYLLLLTVP